MLAHDTTEFSFSSPREDWVVSTMRVRAFSHMSRSPSARMDATSAGHCRTAHVPRQEPPKREKHTEKFPEELRESFRWKALATEVGDLLQGIAAAIHVMDSEADAYELLEGLNRQ